MKKFLKYRNSKQILQYIYKFDSAKASGWRINYFSLFILLLLCHIAPASEIDVPSVGKWKNQPIGTYTVRRSIQHDHKNDTKVINIRKSILLGQDKEGNIYTLSGKADENGRFISTPKRSIGKAVATVEYHPILKRSEHTKVINDIPITVEELEYGPIPGNQMTIFKKTRTILKGYPEIVLEHYYEGQETYKGETRECPTVKRELVNVYKKTLFGKEVLVFDTQRKEISRDGAIIPKHTLSYSPDIPRYIIKTYEELFDRDGKLSKTVTYELIKTGQEVKEAQDYIMNVWAKTSNSIVKPVDSPYCQWRIKINEELGFSRERALDLVRSTAPDDSVIASNKKHFEEVNVAWRKWKEKPDQNNYSVLIKVFENQIKGNLVWFKGPDAEDLGNEMLQCNNQMIRREAAILLARMAKHRYSKVLRDILIEQNYIDTKSLSSLTKQDVATVLENTEAPYNNLWTHILEYAPVDRVMPEVIRRLQDEGTRSFEQTALFKILSSCDRNEARAYVKKLADSISRKDFNSNQGRRRFGVNHIINAACTLRIEGVEKLFIKWIRWLPEKINTNTPRAALSAYGLVAFMVREGLYLYDPDVTAALRNYLYALPPESVINILISCRLNNNHLGLDFPIEQVRKMLKASALTPFGEGSAKRFATVFCYLSKSHKKEILSTLIEYIAPEYDPNVDLHEAWIENRKTWYLKKKGLKPLNLSDIGSSNYEDFFVGLDNFGKPGHDLLLHLYDWPDFRGYFYKSVRGASTNKDYWRKLIIKEKEEKEKVEFDRGLTLWCLGDLSMAEQYEPWLTYPTSHYRKGDVYGALSHLPKTELTRIVKKYGEKLDLDNLNRLASALAQHQDKELASYLLVIFDKQISSGGRIYIGRYINQLAKRNFGVRRKEMVKWIETLP